MWQHVGIVVQLLGKLLALLMVRRVFDVDERFIICHEFSLDHVYIKTLRFANL